MVLGEHYYLQTYVSVTDVTATHFFFTLMLIIKQFDCFWDFLKTTQCIGLSCWAWWAGSAVVKVCADFIPWKHTNFYNKFILIMYTNSANFLVDACSRNSKSDFIFKTVSTIGEFSFLSYCLCNVNDIVETS